MSNPRFLGFYDNSASNYEFTNFYKDGNGWFAEFSFQKAKLNLIADDRLRNQLIHKYNQTVKNGRDAFNFVKAPRVELNNRAIDDVISDWHAMNKEYGITHKEVAMGLTLIEKFNDPTLNTKLLTATNNQTVLVEESPNDGYWGFSNKEARNRKRASAYGENRLGLMLTALGRAKQDPSFKKQPSPEEQLKFFVNKYYLPLLEEFRNYNFEARPNLHTRLKTTTSSSNSIEPTASPLPVSHTSLFSKTKPKPDSPEVLQANRDLVTSIQQTFPSFSTDVVIRKGNINGTFKFGFANDQQARAFMTHLQELGYLKDLTYFNGKDKYPMDENGFVTPNGKYKHIVRFELPEKALTYLQHINPDNAKLYETIMGTQPSPKPHIT